MTLHSLHWQQALQGSNSWHNCAKDCKTWKLHGRWEWEWVFQSIFHDLGDPGLFFIFKQLARVGILVFSILGRRWNCDEMPRKTRSSQSPSLPFTAQAERSWAEIQKCSWCCWNRDGKGCRWKQLLVLRLRSLTAKGKGQNKVKEPRKRGPRFFCCYLPLNQCPERSSWALLPAHSDRKAARREISHQLLRKPQELGEKPGPGESSDANKSTQTKNEWEFLFPTLLVSVFVDSSTATGPFPLRGGVIYENKQPPDSFGMGEWSYPACGTATVHLALQLHPGKYTGTHWERFPSSFLHKNSTPIFLSPQQSWAAETTF